MNTLSSLTQQLFTTQMKKVYCALDAHPKNTWYLVHTRKKSIFCIIHLSIASILFKCFGWLESFEIRRGFLRIWPQYVRFQALRCCLIRRMGVCFFATLQQARRPTFLKSAGSNWSLLISENQIAAEGYWHLYTKMKSTRCQRLLEWRRQNHLTCMQSVRTNLSTVFTKHRFWTKVDVVYGVFEYIDFRFRRCIAHC